MDELTRFYKGKKVLVTGHTGFKCSWLAAWLFSMGAKIVGVSDAVPTQPAHYDLVKKCVHDDRRVDIRNKKAVYDLIREVSPDFVFHLAAQAILPESYESPLGTFETNIIGTANILDALRRLNRDCIAIMVTSDKCYENVEWEWGYRETDRLGGKDPYSGSKGAAELVIRSFVESFFNNAESRVRVGVGRAGNVVGGGDWAPYRIVPDCVRRWALGENAEIRNPESTRPWQHVLEPLRGYLTLGMALESTRTQNGETFNFGPSATEIHTVAELINEVSKYWPGTSWVNVEAKKESFHEAGLLSLNCDKAAHYLGWRPILKFDETASWTGRWYRAFFQEGPEAASRLTFRQIKQYQEIESAPQNF